MGLAIDLAWFGSGSGLPWMGKADGSYGVVHAKSMFKIWFIMTFMYLMGVVDCGAQTSLAMPPAWIGPPAPRATFDRLSGN